MARKKRPKAIPVNETVHFRPGQWLGQMIAQRADAWRISRGAAAKRLVGLAVCGLADDVYDQIEEISRISTGSFEVALQHVFVEIVERESSQGQRLEGDKRREVANDIVHRYRLMHGLTDKPAKDQAQVRVRRTDE